MQKSCTKLHQNTADIYYLRSPETLFKTYGTQVTDFIEELKETKQIKKTGISVYNEQQIHEILEYFTPDVIQVPCNILDQRLLESGVLRDLKQKNIEIHARSVFMQGLLLMNPQDVPDFFSPIKSHLNDIQETLKNKNIAPLKACLNFITSQSVIDRIIIGVSSLTEWQEILDNLANPLNTQPDWRTMKLDNEKYLNPAKWSV